MKKFVHERILLKLVEDMLISEIIMHNVINKYYYQNLLKRKNV